MCVYNANICSLQIEIILRINHPIGSPADPQKRMILYHGHRAFPKSQPHFRRRIHFRKHGSQPFIKDWIQQQKAAPYHQASQQNTPVFQHTINRKKDSNDKAGAAGIGHGQAGCQQQHCHAEHTALSFGIRLDEQAKRHTYHDIEISRQYIRILPGRKYPLPQFGKSVAVYPFHRTDIDTEHILIKSVKHDQNGSHSQRSQPFAKLRRSADLLPDNQISQGIDPDQIVPIIETEPPIRRSQYGNTADQNEQPCRNIKGEMSETE